MLGIATNNYLIIKIVDAKKETISGIALPDQSLRKPQWGFVVDVGEGLVDGYTGIVPPPVFETGDLVYFMQHGPEDLDLTKDGLEKLHVIGEGDVYVKIKTAADGSINLIPMGNYLHIKILQDENLKATAGGILLPEQIQESPTRAEVLAVGTGQRIRGGFHSPRVNVGDIIRFRPNIPFMIKFDDLGMKEAKQHIISYGDVVAIETNGYLDKIKEVLDNLPKL